MDEKDYEKVLNKTLKEWSKVTPVPPMEEFRVIRRLGKKENLIKGSNK